MHTPTAGAEAQARQREARAHHRRTATLHLKSDTRWSMCTPSPLIPHETALLAQLASMPSLVYQREWRHPKPPHHFLAPRDCIMIQLREKGGLRVEPDPPPPPPQAPEGPPANTNEEQSSWAPAAPGNFGWPLWIGHRISTPPFQISLTKGNLPPEWSVFKIKQEIQKCSQNPKKPPPPPPSRPLWTPLPTPRWLGLELKGPPPPPVESI